VALLVLVDARPPSPGVPAEIAEEDLEGLLRAELAGAGAAALTAALPALRDRVRAHLRAFGDYRPRPLACPVALFLAADRPPGETAGPAALWRPLAPGGLAVETLPGNHFSLLQEPRVAILAESIRLRLEKLEGASNASESP